jgi:hypothetical protein
MKNLLGDNFKETLNAGIQAKINEKSVIRRIKHSQKALVNHNKCGS